MKLSIFFCSGLLFSFLISGDGFLERVYPQLIGRYVYLKSITDKETLQKGGCDTVYSIAITKKDKFMTFVNGKLKAKYNIEEDNLPFLDDQNHIVIGVNNEFEPVFFRKDTLVVQSFPLPYSDNYFVKK